MLLVRYFPKHKGLLHIYSATFLCDDTRTITEMCAYICGRPQTVDKRDTCAHGSRTRAAKEFHFWFAQRCAQRRVTKRGEQWASNWKACKGIWNGLEEEGRRMRWSGVKINKPQWVRRVHPWRAWKRQKNRILSRYTRRENPPLSARGEDLIKNSSQACGTSRTTDRVWRTRGNRGGKGCLQQQPVDLRGSEGRTSSFACGISSNPLG